MGKLIIPEIRDNYTFYNQLLKERKSIFDEVIEITEIKQNQKNVFIKNTIVNENLLNEIVFITEVNAGNYKCFHFKLKCSSFAKIPFFWFDSDGGAHRNYDDENIPFKDQQIPTPHFNWFNENGLSLAFQTEQLKNEKEKKALEDISLCVAHFCTHSNIRLNKDDFPSISILPGTFQLSVTKDDPNSNIQFS